MSKNNKVVKYKVVNTNIDKKFIGKDLDLQKVKAKGGPGSDGGIKPPKQRKAPAWFIEFRDEQREFNKSVMQRFDEQAKFNKQQLEFNKSIREDLSRIVKLNNLKH